MFAVIVGTSACKGRNRLTINVFTAGWEQFLPFTPLSYLTMFFCHVNVVWINAAIASIWTMSQ